MSEERLSLKKKALFSLGVVLALLLLMEGAARLFWSPLEHPGLTPLDAHPSRGWALQDRASSAGVSFRLGEHGLREVPRTGAPYRILTTGDSSIFGHGLPDSGTLHMQLHESFKRRGKSVDVLTAGVPGYTTVQTLDQMNEFGWEMGVNYLVVGNLWSDSNFKSSEDNPPPTGQSGMPEPPAPPSEPGFLMRRSRALQLLDSVLNEAGPEKVDWITSEGPEGPRRVELEDYRKNLQVMFSEAQSRGIGALFLLPCNRELAAGIPTPPKGWPWDPYFEAAESVAEKNGVPVLRGCDVASDVGLQGDAAFLDEMHPTAALNGAYAEAIAESLIGLGWP